MARTPNSPLSLSFDSHLYLQFLLLLVLLQQSVNGGSVWHTCSTRSATRTTTSMTSTARHIGVAGTTAWSKFNTDLKKEFRREFRPDTPPYRTNSFEAVRRKQFVTTAAEDDDESC